MGGLVGLAKVCGSRKGFRQTRAQDAGDHIEGPDDPEIALEPSPPPSPVHEPEQALQPEQVPPVRQPHDASPNRRAPRQNRSRSRSRSRSPPHNPHQNSEYIFAS